MVCEILTETQFRIIVGTRFLATIPGDYHLDVHDTPLLNAEYSDMPYCRLRITCSAYLIMNFIGTFYYRLHKSDH